MDIAAQITINISPADAERLFKTAMLSYLQSRFSISANSKDVMVKFKATNVYDSMDRGHGSPEFSGVEVTINKAMPAQPSGAYADR